MDAEEYENSLFCRLHPTQSLVGICSACLQEKLGKLVFAERDSFFFHEKPCGVSASSESEFQKTHNSRFDDFEKRLRRRESSGSAEGSCNGRSRAFLRKSKSVATSTRRVVALQESSQGLICNKKGSVSSSSSSIIWSFFSFGKRKHKLKDERGECNEDSVEVVRRSRSLGFGNGRVRCGGIFVGFGGITVSRSDEDLAEKAGSGSGGKGKPRSKGWRWAFSSPFRTFIQSSKRWSNRDTGNVVAAPANAASAVPGSFLQLKKG